LGQKRKWGENPGGASLEKLRSKDLKCKIKRKDEHPCKEAQSGNSEEGRIGGRHREFEENKWRKKGRVIERDGLGNSLKPGK